MIKILLDQNIPAQAVQWLQEKVGSDAEILSTRMLGTSRMTDAELFHYCQSHNMVLVTYDEDFQNPLMFPGQPGFGVVRLNIYPTLGGISDYPIEKQCRSRSNIVSIS